VRLELSARGVVGQKNTQETMSRQIRIAIVAVFSVLAILSAFFVFQLKFSFDFEQFFPEGDEDLEFFRDFIEEFETDDNFLLVAIRREEGVFDSTFLNKFHDFTLECRDLPNVLQTQSLTKFEYPVRTPFGITTVPAIHRKDPSRYEADRKQLLNDERFVHNLITEDGKALVVYLKTVERINLDQAKALITNLNELIEGYNFEKYHYLGRPYFQKELVAMQKREIIFSSVVSGILVTIILFLIYRRIAGVTIALASIGLGMLLFMGFLGAAGRELNAMSALYPVLMIIVGTSDVIHIMTKYVDELRKGKDRKSAINVTVREIGIATLLTSITTAIGFFSLVTSRVTPIKDFGINAAVGVLIAYITVIFFTTALLTWFPKDSIIKDSRGTSFWDKYMLGAYWQTRRYPRYIALGGLLFLILSGVGISRISTNYDIIGNMPIGRKITEDFKYFEEKLTGFRPMEFAIYTQEGYDAMDFEVQQEIAKIETYLQQYPEVRGVSSPTTVFKSIHMMSNNNQQDAYQLPETRKTFERYRQLADRIPSQNVNVLVSRDSQKARITSRIMDMGADSVDAMGKRIDRFVANNVDSTVIRVHRTGTGLIIDKNAEYIRRNLLQGLGMAIGIVSLIMALLFRNWRMLLISLVPNIFPLLLAGALLGYLGIELEAGVSIVFAVVFGIAVDDTIHFLSKYKLARNRGLNQEEALQVTFTETGKAIVLTSIILFFGFLVMLFSIHPPSVVVGLLISLTLVSALVSDMALIPVMIRWAMPEKQDGYGKERPSAVDESVEQEV